MVRRLTVGMAAHPKRVLAVVLAVTALFGIAARDVRLDNNFAALFATDSDEARFREEHRATWGPDDGLLVAVLRTDPDTLASPAVTELVDQLTRSAAESLPALDRVDSITSVDVVGIGPEGQPVAGPAFGDDSPFELPFDERLALARSSALGAADLVAEDGSTFLVVGSLGMEYDSYEAIVDPAEEFRSLVESAVSASDAPVSVRFSGVAYTRIAAIDLMQSDLFRLAPLATLLMALLLFAVFRRVAAVVGPLLAIGSSLVITAGIVGLAGDDLNQVTIIYPILLMGVVVSGSTHLIHRYYRERAAGHDGPTAAHTVMERLRRAALVAAFTTSVGFASLIVAELRILHEFGVYLALGVMAAALVQLALVPAVLTIADSRPPASYRTELATSTSPGSVPSLTERYVRIMLRPAIAVTVLAATVALLAASVLFARTATFDYALSDMLDEDHPVSEGNATIDGELSGVVPLEISLLGSAGDFRDPDVLRRVHELAEWLEQTYGVRTVSAAGAVAELASVGSDAPVTFPDDPVVVEQALTLVESFRGGESLNTLVRDDWSRARMWGFATDHGGNYVVELRNRFEERAAAVLGDDGINVRVTGEAPVAYEGMNDLTRELVQSTLLAMVMITLAVLAMFRSGWLTVVSALPNMAPVLLGLGVYRLTSDVLDPLPSIVLCIAIGLAADDTIHMINRWQELRRQEPAASATDTLIQAVTSVRPAMVWSTAVLVAGFLALTLSGFGWNQQLGWLGAVVILLALLADLVVSVASLGLLARWYDRRRSWTPVVDAPGDPARTGDQGPDDDMPTPEAPAEREVEAGHDLPPLRA